MNNIEHLIRLSEASNHEIDPEPKTSGLWLYALAIAGLGIVAGVVWAVFFA